jgi:hypothetical protein
LLKPGIRGIDLVCQLHDALLDRPLLGARSLDLLQRRCAPPPDLTGDLASKILQGGPDPLELRIGIADMRAEVGFALDQFRLLITQ